MSLVPFQQSQQSMSMRDIGPALVMQAFGRTEAGEAQDMGVAGVVVATGVAVIGDLSRKGKVTQAKLVKDYLDMGFDKDSDVVKDLIASGQAESAIYHRVQSGMASRIG